MGRRWKTWFVVVGLPALAILILLTRGPEAATPNPPGTFSFAVLGDAPYYAWEEVQYRLVLQELDAHDLRFVVHVGDIFWHPCSDENYRKILGWLNGLRHPVIYTPGDNEWVDCWEPGSGSFVPNERLDRIRQIFFADPAHSLGGRRLPLVSQGGREPYSEFVENARWMDQGIVFATINIPGSTNGMDTSRRTEAPDQTADRRTDAAVAWVHEAFAAARAANASAVVLGFHANADLEEPVDSSYRKAFDPLISVVEEETERFPRPVLLVHGDGHDYTVDHPLVRRTTRQRLKNLTRLQAPGSPLVGWVRVVVTPGAASPFAFEEHVVPRWKYW